MINYCLLYLTQIKLNKRKTAFKITLKKLF